ncbi:MAG: hypothetical protein JO027_18025 [Solirubrobacterales bacterium]|nr:hypothetical protein [Solirubrobacterales bacterium]
MSSPGRLAWLAALLVLMAGVTLAGAPAAHAAGLTCAQTSSPSTPAAPSSGRPCWTDVLPYPFGSDGNPVDPTSAFCDGSTDYGPHWTGDFGPAFGSSQTPPPEPPCYLQVSSLAFRAWNRGLAATTQPTTNSSLRSNAPVAFGVWLYNGNDWSPDPTFPGSAVCPGSTILWAGKLDYWLIGSSSTPQTTVCRFDGVNLQWEPLTLPAATVARLPTNLSPTGAVIPVGGVTSGGCYSWDNCWFFGTDGIEVHWDGQELSDVSQSPAVSPWLEGDFTSAVAGTDPSGRPFGLAVTRSSMSNASGTAPTPLPAAPDGSPPAQMFGSQGGSFEPLEYSPPAAGLSGDPFTTDLTQVSADSQGDVWIAGTPAGRLGDPPDNVTQGEPAPLLRLTATGAPASCPGYGANTFTVVPRGSIGDVWTGLSTFPDGSALAGAASQSMTQFPPGSDHEPALVNAVCGQLPVVTEFRRPDPLGADPSPVPVDFNGQTTAVAANASNDAWAATSDGNWILNPSTSPQGGPLAPHLYLFTDGQPPDAPAGDDNETRPSLFTLGPPVFQIGTATIVVTPGTTTTTTRRHKPRKIKLPAPIYSIHTKLVSTGNGTYTLYLTFKVRRKVKIGVQALKGKKVVASSGVRRFSGHSGQLALKLNRSDWPSGLRWVTPKR